MCGEKGATGMFSDLCGERILRIASAEILSVPESRQKLRMTTGTGRLPVLLVLVRTSASGGGQTVEIPRGSGRMLGGKLH
jgi:hypothetical protein